MQYLSEPIDCYDMEGTANTATWKGWNEMKGEFEEYMETSKQFDDAENRNVFYKYRGPFPTFQSSFWQHISYGSILVIARNAGMLTKS